MNVLKNTAYKRGSKEANFIGKGARITQSKKKKEL